MAAIAELIDKYQAGAKQLRQATLGLSPEQLTARPISGKWSVLEVVCHIADFEPVYADRMKRVITHDHPLLMGAGQDLYAAKLHYQERNLEEELATVDCVRVSMARILRQLPAEAFQRTGVHSERGIMSLEQLLDSIGNHITHHLPFIAEKRRAFGLTG